MSQKNDEFLTKFMARIPKDVSDSFTEEQLNAVVTVFGNRAWGAHAVDIRGTGRWLKHKFYYVLLLGRESRDIDRVRAEHKMRPIWTLLNTVMIFLFILMVLGTLSIGLYSVKVAFGVDVFPEFDMLPDQSIQIFLKSLFE